MSVLNVLHAVHTARQLKKLTITGVLVNQYNIRSLVGNNIFGGNGASISEFEVSDIISAMMRCRSVSYSRAFASQCATE